MREKNETGKICQSAESENEKSAGLSDWIEMVTTGWMPQAKMSQVLAKIQPLRREDNERIAND